MKKTQPPKLRAALGINRHIGLDWGRCARQTGAALLPWPGGMWI
jgi:hypothetical protein